MIETLKLFMRKKCSCLVGSHFLIYLEQNQREQFIKFSDAWDSYMAEYEQAAYINLEQLNQEQQLAMLELRQNIVKDYPIIGKPTNKKIIDIQKKEMALTQMKKYDAAEKLKRKREALEAADIANFIEQDIQRLIKKEETKLKSKHEAGLTALLKRIQRDRNEQLLHRQIDSKRMIQRNKNLITNIQKKQEMECKKTHEFMQYSLGTRAPSKTINQQTRSQSNRRRRPKNIKKLDMTHDQKDRAPFFITERGQNEYQNAPKRLNKSYTGKKSKKDNRGSSVVTNRDRSTFVNSRGLDNSTSLQNRSAYGLVSSIPKAAVDHSLPKLDQNGQRFPGHASSLLNSGMLSSLIFV